jgi:glycosyltransferase involved in cell wall biosynthesis
MRILIVNDARSGAGGVETYLASLIEPLVRRAHAVALLHAGSAREQGPVTIGVPDSWSAADAGVDNAIAGARAWGPDVCYSNNMRPLEIDERVAAEWPTIKMMHGYFGTCVSGLKTFAFPHVVACERRCGPACLVHYMPRRCGARNPAGLAAEYMWSARQQRLFARYAAIVVASHHMRRQYAAQGIAGERLHAIPLFAAPATAVVPGGAPIDVLFLARMTRLKGGDLLLHAVYRASRSLGRAISVTLAGDGPERTALERLALSLGVRASLPGWVDPEERARLFARATLVAVPSIWPEPFGLVGLEGAAFGVPAVAFDVGGISSWLTDGSNGLLVPPRTGSKGLGEAMAAALSDSALRRRLSDGARAVASRLTAEAHVAALEAVFAAAAAARAA